MSRAIRQFLEKNPIITIKRRAVSTRQNYLASFLLLALAACDGLPRNYMDLPLNQKIEATEKFYARGGLSSHRAEAGISLHGYEAAEAMLPYLEGDKGLPMDVVLNIVYQIQRRGCSLKGTRVEAEVRKLQTSTNSAPIAEQARHVLEVIAKDLQNTDLLDVLGPGACAE